MAGARRRRTRRGRRRSNWPQQPPSHAPGRRSEPDWGAPPGRPPGRTYPGGRRRRFWGQPGRRGRRIALVLGTVVVLIIALVAGSYIWLDGKLNRSVTLPASAADLGRDELADHRLGHPVGPVPDAKGRAARRVRHRPNSDSLMLLHLGGPHAGADQHPARLLRGDPRPRREQDQRRPRVRRPQSLLMQTVENATGLTINHYMGIGFEGLVDVTNKVGGVYVCLKQPVQDSYSGVSLKAGCQTLNGTQALEFVRDRHSFATGDLQRIQDQRAFLKALLSKASSPGVFLNPFKALPFGSSAAGSISVDQGTHLYRPDQGRPGPARTRRPARSRSPTPTTRPRRARRSCGITPGPPSCSTRSRTTRPCRPVCSTAPPPAEPPPTPRPPPSRPLPLGRATPVGGGVISALPFSSVLVGFRGIRDSRAG